MEQDLFKLLPSEIIINILFRLPIRTIAISKCACKSWLDLLESDEFVRFYLSRFAAALAVLTPEENSSRCTVFELEGEIDVESSHYHHYKYLTKFNFPFRVTIKGSANGMLLLRKYDLNDESLYVCNPITREFIILNCPKDCIDLIDVTYGFGVSKISGQHKVVRIIPHADYHHVYTLETKSWRLVEAANASIQYNSCFGGTFVNGNLHWLVLDPNAVLWISCFDLETECFSTFSVPTLEGKMECMEDLSALRDCLCFCDNSSSNYIVIIWLMNEYGNEKSWTKDYVINFGCPFNRFGYGGLVFVNPIKVFKDGGILMACGYRKVVSFYHSKVFEDWFFCYYSNKTKTIQKIGAFDIGGNHHTLLLTPSFLSLTSFGMDNVISF